MFPGRDLDLINVLLSQSQGSGTIGHECRKTNGVASVAQGLPLSLVSAFIWLCCKNLL